jgi:hypothetical protein
MYVYIYIHIYISDLEDERVVPLALRYMYVCMYVYIYIYIYISDLEDERVVALALLRARNLSSFS